MATQDDLGKLEQSLSQALTDAVNSLREGLTDQAEQNFDNFTKINNSLASLESQTPFQSGLSNHTPQFRGGLDDAVAFLQHFDLYTTFHMTINDLCCCSPCCYLMTHFYGLVPQNLKRVQL